MANYKRIVFIFLSCFLAFFLDRLTKFYFVFKPFKSFVVLEDFLILELHKNKGVAFGFLINNWIYYLLFAVIIFILFYLLLDSFRNKDFYLITCLSFIIVGAFSNLIDRFRYGAVIDFINVPFWSIFNLADCYIVIAVIFWLVYLFKNEGKNENKKVSEKN